MKLEHLLENQYEDETTDLLRREVPKLLRRHFNRVAKTGQDKFPVYLLDNRKFFVSLRAPSNLDNYVTLNWRADEAIKLHKIFDKDNEAFSELEQKMMNRLPGVQEFRSAIMTLSKAFTDIGMDYVYYDFDEGDGTKLYPPLLDDFDLGKITPGEQHVVYFVWDKK